jgi:hypothetical protein
MAPLSNLWTPETYSIFPQLCAFFNDPRWAEA